MTGRQFVFARPHREGLFGRDRDNGEILAAGGATAIGVILALVLPGPALKVAALVLVPALGFAAVFTLGALRLRRAAVASPTASVP